MKNPITIQATIHAPVEKVWEYYTLPEHIMKWNAASDDWHTPKSVNDLRVGGKFSSRMEAKDGSMGFDFHGTYTDLAMNERIEYVMDESERNVKVVFETVPEGTHVTLDFEPEMQNSRERQEEGWQSILNNFKKYVEEN
jgi:uncharacterized protein YndB with AHSA1/START domain